MRFVAVLAFVTAVLAPASVSAKCDVVDRAPLVYHDRRPCQPAIDESVFVRSTGAEWIAHFAHGYACLGEGQYRTAAAEFAAAHAGNPHDVRTVMYEAIAYDRLGDSARVARLVALARRTARESRPPMNTEPLAGATLLLNGHYAQAFGLWSGLAEQPYNRVMYEDAHAMQPYQEGLRLAVRGDYCGALRVLSPLVALSPGFGDIRFIMGAAYYALGDGAQARYEWDGAAIETPPQPGFWVAYPIQWTALNLLAQMPRR